MFRYQFVFEVQIDKVEDIQIKFASYASLVPLGFSSSSNETTSKGQYLGEHLIPESDMCFQHISKTVNVD